MTTSTRKRFVEQCWTIEVSDFMTNPNTRGYITWHDQFTGEEIAGVNYSLALVKDELAVLRLQFDLDGKAIRQEIPMLPTNPNFGGRRWWFQCPVNAGEGNCGNRVRKLYLPRKETYFGCRKCHVLAYRSTRGLDLKCSADMLAILSQ